MKIRTGDTVVITTGKDKGKQGTVIRTLPLKNRVVVEGVNMRIRHIKKTQSQAGQRISYEASIDVSNVMVLDPKTKKPTRLGYKVDEKTGRKQRIARKSGEVIPKAASTRAKIKDAKGSKETKDSKDDKKKSKTSEAEKPSKNPFWKRGEKSDDAGEGGSGSKGPDLKAMPTAHRSQGG